MKTSDGHDIHCPYMGDIAMTKARVDLLLPDDFLSRFESTAVMVQQMHGVLFENGFEKRLRRVEQRVYFFSGASAMAGAVIGWGISILGKVL